MTLEHDRQEDRADERPEGSQTLARRVAELEAVNAELARALSLAEAERQRLAAALDGLVPSAAASDKIDRLVRRDEGMRLLAEASATLTESLDEAATLDSLARLAVERLADGAMITLVQADGSFVHATTRSRDDALAIFAMETERMYPLPPDAPSGYPRAIRTGEPELVPEGAFDDEILPTVAADATHLDRLRQLKMYSAMVIPLVARERTLGAMTLVLHGPDRRRPFDAEDLALAMDLGRRAGLALENARLFEAERRARTEAARARADTERSAELTRRLQEITATFARTISLREAAETTLSQGIDALSAESGVVYLMNAAQTALELVAFRGMPEEIVTPFAHLALDVPMPVTDAVHAGEILYLTNREEIAARYQTSQVDGKRVTSDSWVAIPLLYGGRTLGAVVLGFGGSREFSVTDRALVDALGRHCAQAMERARLLDAEREARDDAVRANRAKSDLLAKVSHETRQPVHATIGWVDMLELELHGPVTEPQHEALRRIKQNQLRLLSVLNDLLDIARIEAGRIDVVLKDIAVTSIVDVVEGTIAPQMRDKRIDFEFCAVDPTVKVRADQDLLVGILSNLLGNAAKFTPEQGKVVVRCEAAGAQVTIAVSDTGIGIEPQLVDRVFEPFFQVESGFTRTRMGTGLGLAISREAARAMGGDVTVTSRLGEGSTFTLTLVRALVRAG
jgi:signal transduction histidine kinase